MSDAARKLTYTFPEAAEAIGIAISTLYQYADAGVIPSFRIGTRRLIGVAALEQWVSDRSTASLQPARPNRRGVTTPDPSGATTDPPDGSGRQLRPVAGQPRGAHR